MIDLLRIILSSLQITLVILLDILLIASTLFIVVYAASMVWRGCRPSRRHQPWHAATLPLLFSLCIPAVFTPVGSFVAAIWQDGLGAVLRTPEFFPSLPVTLWLAGAAMLSLRLVVKSVALRRELRDAVVLTDDQAYLEACAELAIKPGSVSLMATPAVSGACSWGLRNPVVLIPDDFTADFTDAERYCIYLHELLHIRRRDSIGFLIAAAAKTFFWFHPVVHAAAATATDDIEHACDTATLQRRGVTALQYARLVLKAQVRLSGPLPYFSAGSEGVRARIGVITGDTAFLPRMGRRVRLALYGILLFSLASVVVRNWTPPRQEPDIESVQTMPDGKRYSFSMRKIWDGALACYSTGKCVPFESER
ncbi:MAG: M56 family metallopeptidase [Planctomycetaceae bacterium]|nr:M56 family metallopeptidase [Planctomycetaceae bacterium]